MFSFLSEDVLTRTRWNGRTHSGTNKSIDCKGGPLMLSRHGNDTGLAVYRRSPAALLREHMASIQAIKDWLALYP